MKTFIKEETLDRMFNDDIGKRHLKQSGRCSCCGSDVEITIEKTSRGYGFQGGVLYELNTDRIHMQCEHCFKNIESTNHLEEAG